MTAEEGALCSGALAIAGHLPVGLCSAPCPFLSAPVPDLLIPPSLQLLLCSWDLTGTHGLFAELWIQLGAGHQVTMLVPGMRASSALRFTKSSHGWFAEALPSLEEQQEGAGGDSPARRDLSSHREQHKMLLVEHL